MLEKSRPSTPGTPRTIWITAGTRMAKVTRSRSMASTIAAGSTSRCKTTAAPAYSPMSAPADPAMWYRGITDSVTERSCTPISAAPSASAVPMLVLVMSAPLGSPVVPDVYICITTSSPAIVRPGSTPRPAVASQSS